jgi:hypothetical protein
VFCFCIIRLYIAWHDATFGKNHNVCDKTLNVFNEIKSLAKEYENTNNVNEFNNKALNIMIDSDVITRENAQKLIDKGKIKGVYIQ